MELLPKIARSARTGDYGTASSLLNRCIPRLQTVLSGGKVPPAVLARITPQIGALLAAQQRGDWVVFADVLEYSLPDLLAGIVS
ncbi:MAG: hypothetical protein MUF22_09210 [Chitinispirillaceae bacterium]|nr:hypothetical protein [Chitinispirillaceae bacterium]